MDYSHSMSREDTPTALRLPIIHIDKGNAIICGSATGCARVLDARTGELLQVLVQPYYDHKKEDSLRSRGQRPFRSRGADRAFVSLVNCDVPEADRSLTGTTTLGIHYA